MLKTLADNIVLLVLLSVILLFLGFLFGSYAPYILMTVGALLMLASIRVLFTGLAGVLAFLPCLTLGWLVVSFGYYLLTHGVVS